MNMVRQISDLFAYLFTGLTSVERKKKLFYLPGLGHLPHPAGINGYVHRHCASTFLERISDHGDAPFPPYHEVSPAELIGKFPDVTQCDHCGAEFQPTDEPYNVYWIVSQRDLRSWMEILNWMNDRGAACAKRGEAP